MKLCCPTKRTNHLRLVEASPEALAEYKDKLAKLLKDSDALDAKVLANVKALIGKMRDQILIRIAEAQAQEGKEGLPSWGPYWVPKLIKEFSQVIQTISQQFKADLSEFAIQSYQIGANLADDGLDLALENKGSKKAPGILITEMPKLDAELMKIGGSFSADLITQMERDQIKFVSKEVATSVSLGEPPGKLMSRLAGMVNKGPWRSVEYRAEIIARTEIARIQELARKQRMMQQQQVFPGIKLYQQWITAPILKWPCKTCAPYEGHVWDIDGNPHLPPDGEKMPDLPVHPNCFPGSTKVRAGYIEAAFRRFYQGPMVEVFIEGSAEPVFSVTPNHPILTARGLVRAGKLKPGDDLVKGSFVESIPNQDKDWPETSLEEIFNFLSYAGLVSRMTSTVMDFHGDGQQGQVEVIAADAELRMKIQSDLEKLGLNLAFAETYHSQALLSSFGSVMAPFIGSGPSGSVSALLWGHFTKADAICFANSPSFNTRLHQCEFHGCSSHFEPFRDFQFGDPRIVKADNLVEFVGMLGIGGAPNDGCFSFRPELDASFLEGLDNGLLASPETHAQLIDAFTPEVATDKVILVREYSFSGHVYNLQTRQGFYGIYSDNRFSYLAKNCRCTCIPWVDDMEYVDDEDAEAMGEAVATATWQPDMEPPQWSILMPDDQRFPLVPTSGEWNIEAKTPDKAPDEVIVDDVEHLAKLKGIKVDRVEVYRNPSEPSQDASQPEEELPESFFKATPDQVDAFVAWQDVVISKKNGKSDQGQWSNFEWELDDADNLPYPDSNEAMWKLYKEDLAKQKAGMFEKLTGEKPLPRPDPIPKPNLHSLDQVYGFLKWAKSHSDTTGGLDYHGLSDVEKELIDKIDDFSHYWEKQSLGGFGLEIRQLAGEVTQGKHPFLIAKITDLWPKFHDSKKAEALLESLFGPPKKSLTWSNKEQLTKAMKRAFEVYKQFGSDDSSVSQHFDPLLTMSLDDQNFILEQAADTYHRKDKRKLPDGFVRYVEKGYLTGYATTAPENAAIVKAKVKKEKPVPVYSGPLGHLFADELQSDKDFRELVKLVNFWGADKKIGSLLSKLKTEYKKFEKGKLSFEEFVASIESAISHSFVKKQFSAWKAAPTTGVPTAAIMPAAPVDPVRALYDRMAAKLAKNQPPDPNDLAFILGGLTEEEKKYADTVAKLGYDVWADIKSKLKSGLVVDFEKGKPPSWAHGADLVGFPPYAHPETAQYKGDSELPQSYWPTIPDVVYEDPAKDTAPGSTKQLSAGVVMIEDDGVWLVEPWNHHGGYHNTFPKGQCEPGLSDQQNAIKETWEESGMEPELIGYLGAYEKSWSKTKYYMAVKQKGQPWNCGWETQNVKLVPWNKVDELLNQSVTSSKYADMQVYSDLKTVLAKVEELKKKPGFDKITVPQAIKFLNALEKAEADLKVQKAAEAAAAAVAAQRTADKQAKQAVIQQQAAKLQTVIDNAYDKLARETVTEDDLQFLAAKDKGSAKGGYYVHKQTGKKYMVKEYPEKDQAYTEKAANNFFELIGLNAPKSLLVKKNDGSVAIANEFITGLDDTGGRGKLLGVMSGPDTPAKQQIEDGFAMDCLLANWDVVGLSYDNLVFSADMSDVWRVDNGGSLDFKAMGTRKGSMLVSDAVPELDVMRKNYEQSKAAFGNMSPAAITNSIRKVAALTDDQIRSTVYAAGFEVQEAERLIGILVKRRNVMAGKLSHSVLASKLPQAARIQGVLGEHKNIDDYQEYVRVEYLKSKGRNNPTPNEYKQEFFVARKMKMTDEFIPENKHKGAGQDDVMGWMETKRTAENEGCVGYLKTNKLKRQMSQWQGSPAGCEPYFENLLAATKGSTSLNPAGFRGMDSAKTNQPIYDQELWDAQTASFNAVRSTFKPGEKIILYRGVNNAEMKFNIEEAIAAYLHGKRKIGITVRIASGWASDYTINNRFAKISKPGYSGPDLYNSGCILKKEFDAEQILGGWGLSPGFGEGGSFAEENEFICLADDCDPNDSWAGRVYLDLDTEVFTNLWGPDHPKWKNFEEFRKGSDFKKYLMKMGFSSSNPEQEIFEKYKDRFGPAGQGFEWKESVQRLIESIRLAESELRRLQGNMWDDGAVDGVKEVLAKEAGLRTLQVTLWRTQGITWDLEELEVDWLQEARKEAA